MSRHRRQLHRRHRRAEERALAAAIVNGEVVAEIVESWVRWNGEKYALTIRLAWKTRDEALKALAER